MPSDRPAKLPYLEAKSWAQAQNPLIDGVKGWRALRKTRLLPPGMPAWPQGAYGKEFESWGEFLGTGTVAATRRKFKPYIQARAWARRQRPRITSKSEWAAMIKAGGLPQDIPIDPRSHYAEQFEGWGVFLGTGVIANQCRKMASYQKAKKWAQDQSPIIHSRVEYVRRQRKSGRLDLPAAPDRTYGRQFEGWATFLGIRKLGPSSMIERMLKQELASFLPVNPQALVRLPGADGKPIQVDIHLPTWGLVIEYDGSRFHGATAERDRAKTASLRKAHPGLRVVRIREEPLTKLGRQDLVVKRNLEPLAMAKQVVSHLLDLGLVRTGFRWAARAYLKRKDLAGDVLVGARWRTFEQARIWARAQSLPSGTAWRQKTKAPGFLPADIPAAPAIVYGRQFRGWPDFLGTRTVPTRQRKFWPYERAQAWAKRRGITMGKQWVAMSAAGRLPKALPSNPDATYKTLWRGWGEFLGTAKPKDEPWAGFEEIARWCAAQSPPVRSFSQWQRVKDRPEFPLNFPKTLGYHFGAGVFARLRRRMDKAKPLKPHNPNRLERGG